jgi:hypothetical protein
MIGKNRPHFHAGGFFQPVKEGHTDQLGMAFPLKKGTKNVKKCKGEGYLKLPSYRFFLASWPLA